MIVRACNVRFYKDDISKQGNEPNSNIEYEVMFIDPTISKSNRPTTTITSHVPNMPIVEDIITIAS